jgi:hypothetical protein
VFNPLKHPWVKIALIVAVVGVVIWLCWPPALPRPDESLRRLHPAGYSIIIPPGYDFSMDLKGNPTRIDGMAAQDNRYGSFPPRIAVDRFRKPPDPIDLVERQRYRQGTFLGRPAFVFDGPRGALWHHRIVFEQGGRWFEISVMLPEYVDVPNDRWFEYVKSFRSDPGAAAVAAPSALAPATRPGAAAAATTTPNANP